MSLIADMYDDIAKEKLKIPKERQWSIYEFQATESGEFVLRGSDYEIKKTGKNKGGRRWTKESEWVVVVTKKECEEYQSSWENANGKCFKCEGTGQEGAGYSKELGRLTRPCRKCGATGKPQAQEVAK